MSLRLSGRGLETGAFSPGLQPEILRLDTLRCRALLLIFRPHSRFTLKAWLPTRSPRTYCCSRSQRASLSKGPGPALGPAFSAMSFEPGSMTEISATPKRFLDVHRLDGLPKQLGAAHLVSLTTSPTPTTRSLHHALGTCEVHLRKEFRAPSQAKGAQFESGPPMEGPEEHLPQESCFTTV